MRVPSGQTIEEFIRDDVHEILWKTGRAPRLAYMVNPVDAAAMLARLPFVGASQVDNGKPTWFDMHTEAGYVRIMVDPNHPTGAAHRFVICCKCRGLAMYLPGVELCVACLCARSHRPYAPGEKMTDRHPDSVIAQVVEETIAAQAPLTEPNLASVDDRLPPIEWGKLQRSKSRSPGTAWVQPVAYQPLPAVPEPAFRLTATDGALYVDTPSGPIKVTADPTVRPDEIRVATTCPGYNAVFHINPDPPAERQAARVAEHQRAEAERMPRPDGFDQRQIDAAKAALLAPVPPRYVRTR